MATLLSTLAQRFSTSDWTSEGKSERDETNPTFIRAKGCSRVWMLSSWRFLRFYPGIHKCRPVSLERLHPSALCLILALMEESIISSLYRGNSSCFCTGACFSGDVQAQSLRMRQEVSLCLRVRTESPQTASGNRREALLDTEISTEKYAVKADEDQWPHCFF